MQKDAFNVTNLRPLFLFYIYIFFLTFIEIEISSPSPSFILSPFLKARSFSTYLPSNRATRHFHRKKMDPIFVFRKISLHPVVEAQPIPVIHPS